MIINTLHAALAHRNRFLGNFKAVRSQLDAARCKHNFCNLRTPQWNRWQEFTGSVGDKRNGSNEEETQGIKKVGHRSKQRARNGYTKMLGIERFQG